MINLKTMLMGSVAAISLAAAPALSQQADTTDAEAADTQMTQTATPGRSYEETYGEAFADIGDRNVEELIGTEVVNDAGETIGEVDNFGLSGDQLVAIAGIGGFLGIGEHSVALPMERLTFDGERLVISGVTREELEALPEYNDGDAQTFASNESLSSGYESTAVPAMGTESAAMQPSDDPASDQPMADAEEDVAAAAEADSSEMTADEQMAKANTAEGELEEAGQELAQATEEAGDAVENAAEETGEAVAGATAEVTADAEEMTETAEAEMSEESEEMTSETAEAEMSEEADQMQAEADVAATEEEGGWTDEMNTVFADIADQQFAELIGMDVASADGEVVGEVDNFALHGENVVAIVGVGGFLGIGEHEVALSFGDMTYDGEKLVLSSLTEDQLREMPEYDEAEPNYLPEDGTLRSTYDQ
jgi:sporulation protein YlmC with PRC-barrel domain